jgi:hypothetical protein
MCEAYRDIAEWGGLCRGEFREPQRRDVNGSCAGDAGHGVGAICHCYSNRQVLLPVIKMVCYLSRSPAHLRDLVRSSAAILLTGAADHGG